MSRLDDVHANVRVKGLLTYHQHSDDQVVPIADEPISLVYLGFE